MSREATLRPRALRLMTVLFSAVIGAVTLSVIHASADNFASAGSNEPTYLISSVSIEPVSGSTMPSRASGHTANVVLTYSWRDVYPGPADCQIEFRDQGGSSVGTFRFQLDSYESSGEVGVLAPVPDSAVSGDGVCAAGARPSSDAHLVVSGVRIDEYAPAAQYNPNAPVKARLSARGTWSTGENPFAQQCVLLAMGVDGTQMTFSFTAEVGNGEAFGIGVPSAFLSSTNPSVECHHYEGEGT